LPAPSLPDQAHRIAFRGLRKSQRDFRHPLSVAATFLNTKKTMLAAPTTAPVKQSGSQKVMGLALVLIR